MEDLESLLIQLEKKTQSSTGYSQRVTEPENSKDSVICKNKDCIDGWIYYEDENGGLVARECECRQRRIMQNRLRFANLPDAFKDMTLSNFKFDVYRQENSKGVITIVGRVINAYMKEIQSHRDTGKGLYIFSSTKGSGKTRLVASIANDLMRLHNMQVKFATSSSIIREIKRCWDKDERVCTESELFDALNMTQILIIDDFGTEKIKDEANWIDTRFYDIINERYNGNRITIFTSNYALNELNYDERIKSRVKEMTFQIPFPEECVRDYIAERDNAEMMENIRR